MEYPIYIYGKECGSLEIIQDGLMTAIYAECELCHDIIRLSVYGEGKCAYLGVMRPENNKLTLKKRLSRDAMRSFPNKIEYAANAALELKAEFDPEEMLWFSTQNGCLTAFDGEQSLIAIPSNLKKSALTRIINGREYIIFPGKRKQ